MNPDCFVSISVISFTFPSFLQAGDGQLTWFWLERKREKPAGKVSGNNFVYCSERRACKGNALSAFPLLLFSGRRVENVTPGIEAAILQLWSDKHEAKNHAKEGSMEKIAPSFSMKLWSLCTQSGAPLCRLRALSIVLGFSCCSVCWLMQESWATWRQSLLSTDDRETNGIMSDIWKACQVNKKKFKYGGCFSYDINSQWFK